MPTEEDIAIVRAAILCLVNRERARAGELPLRIDGRMQLASQRHSEEMVAQDYFEHDSPSGQSVADRMRSSGYIYSDRVGFELGENIAWGTLSDATPASIVEAWMASPGHRENILERRYADTGIGVVAHLPASLGEGHRGAVYTQDFGRIVRP
ncbi:MAG TPA: CAP domain-containing protein [Solirubrobacteraceae bacterium]|nr:CAP domain-containing protein [Solirubrobacteraceae bacterium]